MQTGDYPSKLKHAKIIPVFKTGDETKPGNYRPISLLSVFNRLFERLMHKRLTSFIEKKNTSYLNHSMVSEKISLPNMQSSTLSARCKAMGTKDCIRVAFLLI